jgi:hypothetical protein
VLKFNAADDSGIQTYRYAFAEKLPRKFTETTGSTELTFAAYPQVSMCLPSRPSIWAAMSLNARFIASEIGLNERNDLTIRHNAEADVITRPDITSRFKITGEAFVKSISSRALTFVTLFRANVHRSKPMRIFTLRASEPRARYQRYFAGHRLC